MKKKFIFMAMVIALSLLVWPTASQAQFETEQNFFVPKDRTIPFNIIKGGDTIDVSGVLEKDAYLFGNIISIDGAIKGDLMGAASTLKINGTVDGSVRFAAQNIIINGKVGQNVMLVANTVTLGPDAEVGWEFLAAGNLVELEGKVNSNVNVVATQLTISGEIGGRLDTELGTGNLVLKDGAKVAGDISYLSSHELNKADSAEVGGEIKRLEYKKGEKKAVFGAIIGWLFVVSFLGALLVGLILVWLAPKLVHQVSEEITKNWAKVFWQGLLFLVVTPIVALLVAITVIGLPLAGIGMAIYFIAIYLAKIFVAVALAGWLFTVFKAKSKPKLTVLLIVGLAVYVILKVIPIIGWIFGFLAVCIGLGAMYQTKAMILKKYFK